VTRIIWIVDAAYLMKAAPGKFDYLKLKEFLEKENKSTFAESNSSSSPVRRSISSRRSKCGKIKV